jgi:endonuclease YncB( thermonuclease family)
MAEKPETFGPYPGRCVVVHDGDTVILDLDLGFGIELPGQTWKGKTQLSCRVYGINAPELATPEGKEALAYAQTLLSPGDVCSVLSHGWDKFGGRFDGQIQLPDGSDFAQRMLDAGHAKEYYGVGPKV